uniref:GST N-terminal domain-containing protein n=1 Tax=Hucho hucho TaxID=62062 RepID=A0A4W5LYL4_9TELE
MSAGTLYTYPENWRAFKAQIAAQYSGAHLKVASSAPAFTFGQTNRTPAFLNNFPLGKVSFSICFVMGCVLNGTLFPTQCTTVHYFR